MMLILEKKLLNDETRTLIGKYAGPSDDVYQKALLSQITKSRNVAETECFQAVEAYIFRKKRLAKEHIEKALKAISEAFWLSEDTLYEEDQHKMLHRIAKWKHDKLGCWLIPSGDNYSQQCSIALTHKRLGFSIGFTADSICSICQKDEFECKHSKDKTYWIAGRTDSDGKCSICREQNCKEHDDKHIYRINPIFEIQNPVLHEVSIVRKPAIPTARLTELPVSRKDLEKEVGVIDDSIGMVYACHICKGECPGFVEFKRP